MQLGQPQRSEADYPPTHLPPRSKQTKAKQKGPGRSQVPSSLLFQPLGAVGAISANSFEDELFDDHLEAVGVVFVDVVGTN